MIHYRDDMPIVYEMDYPTQTLPSGANTRVEGETPTHPWYVYGGREWVILPVSILLLKWRAQLLDNDQGATSLFLRSNPRIHHSTLVQGDGA